MATRKRMQVVDAEDRELPTGDDERATGRPPASCALQISMGAPARPAAPAATPGNGGARALLPAAAPRVAPVYELLPLAKVRPPKWNPRQLANPAADAELAASVKEVGVQQPIKVRPVDDHYELVFGSRRRQAALAAGLTEIPALIEQLTDAQVLELQVIENVDRDDLHPLEEAEGYRRLRDQHHLSPEEIAAKVGKSRTWVYTRLTLCKLGEPARKAFLAGKLDVSKAQLLARIGDAEQQQKATAVLTRVDQYSDHAMSYREAAKYVQANFMLCLDGCGFPIADAQLVVAAGPCSTCAKHTGNQRELFSDVKSPDVCTDVKCFRAKQEASWARRAAAAEAAGQAVLPAEHSKRVFDGYDKDEVSSRSAYVDLDAKEWAGNKERPWRQILGKSAPPATLARDPTGKVHELVPRAAVAAALKQTGKKVGYGEFAGGPSRGQLSASEKRQRDEQKRRHEVARRALAAVAGAAEKLSFDGKGALDAFLRFVVEAFLHGGWHDTLVEVAKRRALPLRKSKGNYNAEADGCIHEAARLAQGGELRGLVAEIIATHGSYSTWSTEPGPLLVAACELLELDRKQLEAAARKELAAKAPPAAKPKASKAASKQPAKKGRRK